MATTMAHTSPKANGIPLPPEILALITQRLRKPDLKNMRLVCRSLRPFAAPLLFDQVAFSPSSRALKRAKETVLHFGEYVKTLFYFPVKYRFLSFAGFHDFAHSLCDDDTMERCIRQDDEEDEINDRTFQQHIEHSFRSYSSRAQEQWEMDQTGAHLAHLCHILSKIPTAKKLVIGSTGAYSHIGTKDMRHLGIDLSDLCPRSDCILSPEQHVVMQPVPHCFAFPDIRDILHPAMLALYATASAITKLDMQVNNPQDDAFALLSVSAFDRSIPQSRYVTSRLSTLTKLRFNLGLDALDTADELCFNRGDVTNALATARNLECLYISLTPAFEDSLRDRNSLFTFEGILGGCQFPKLKSLVLECFGIKPAALLELLKHSAQLEALYMHDINLITGAWERTAEKIRQILRLREVVLSCLREFGWGTGFAYELTDSSESEVEEFLLRQRQGENPFTEQAIGRTRAWHEQLGCSSAAYMRGHWALERHWRWAMG